jgi:hypothetical protein
MLETIREYAEERLAVDGDADTARLRHARFWMTTAEQADRGFEGPEWQAWRQRTQAAVNDYRAALAWAIAHGHAELALRTATALKGFWAFSFQYEEADRWLTEALAADRGDAAAEVRAAALCARSQFPRGSLDQAERDAAEALAIYTRAGDRAGMSTCLGASSNLHVYRGADATAMALAVQAVDLAESSGDQAAKTWAYWCRLDASEDWPATQPQLLAALALARETGAGWRVGRLLQRAAWIAVHTGFNSEVQTLIAEGLPAARRAEDHQCVSDLLGSQACACLFAGDDDGAARAATEQLTLAQRQRVTWFTYGLLTAAALAAQRGLGDDAAALYGGAEKLYDSKLRFDSERLVFQRVTELGIETLRAEHPLRWTLGLERGRTLAFDALIDLAIANCDRALAPS